MHLSIYQAIAILKKEGIVALPTETVYGLAALATSDYAIEKIYRAKNRPADNPLICHFKNIEQIEEYGIVIPNYAKILMQHFSPGPISYLFNLPEQSPLKAATRNTKTIIVRIPNHPIFLKVLEEIGIPLAAPSANISGRVSPTSAKMVMDDFGSSIDGVVDGAISDVGIESTIIDCRDPKKVKILRPGIIGEKELDEILTPLGIKTLEFTNQNIETTPGSKYKHYAPQTPIYWLEKLADGEDSSDIAYLLTDEQMKNRVLKQAKIIHLGSEKDWNSIAKKLYSNLKKTDEIQIQKAFIIKRIWGNSSAEKAILNRLLKAVCA